MNTTSLMIAIAIFWLSADGYVFHGKSGKAQSQEKSTREGEVSSSSLSADDYFLRANTGKARGREKTAREGKCLSSAKDRDVPVIQQTKEPSSSTFGTSLFSELCAENTDGNVLVSPFSVYQTLSLVKDGATPLSANDFELERLLGSRVVRDQANMMQMQFEANDDTDADVQVCFATSIWANDLKASYIDAANETQSVDAFPLPETYAAVDEWIENKTNGVISELMGDSALDPLTKALFVNAVHFKGAWTYEFDAAETKNGTFVLGNGTEVPASYMNARREMEVIRSSPSLGGAKILLLDYGKRSVKSDPEFSSAFILPASSDDHSMNSVVSGLSSSSISDLLAESAVADVRLKLPRFRLESGPTELKEPLMRMGMRIAFDEPVPEPFKFLLMSDDPSLYIYDIFHGAGMEVTEKGTEAAAASVADIRTRSIPRTVGMAFDRPFIAIVLHRPTGTPLFMGKVENPTFFF